MKNLCLIAIVLIVFSCKEVTFKEPQPRGKKALKEVPPELIGRYVAKDEKESETDTLVINSKGYYAVSDKKGSEIGDSLVLKKYKGYYFVSSNEKPEWLLRVIKQEKNGDLVYMLMDQNGGKFNDFLQKLSKEIKIDSVEVNGEKLYQIDPSPRQLVSLIKKGYFRETMRVQRIK
jgi:hypothetical protein